MKKELIKALDIPVSASSSFTTRRTSEQREFTGEAVKLIEMKHALIDNPKASPVPDEDFESTDNSKNSFFGARRRSNPTVILSNAMTPFCIAQEQIEQELLDHQLIGEEDVNATKRALLFETDDSEHDIVLLQQQQQQQQQQQASTQNKLFLIGLFSAVLSYVIIGAGPVVTRYLQRDCKVPSMSINAIANMSVLVFYLAYRFSVRSAAAIWRRMKRIRTDDNNAAFNNKERASTQSIRSTMQGYLYTLFVQYIFLWILAIVIMVRSVTNLLSSRFTKATNVQLVNLCAPFMVSILSKIIYAGLSSRERQNSSQQADGTTQSSSMKETFSGEKLSFGMIICMLFTLLGGATIILALSTDTFWEFPSPAKITTSFTGYDALGMGIALFSTFVLALNNITLKIATTSSNGESRFKTLSGEDLFLFHLVVLGAGYCALALILREDLSVWLHLPPLGYTLFALYAFLNYFIGNIVYLAAIKYFGATNTSSILALSLISTITVSWLVLGESIHNLYQIIGGLIVLSSITAFMLLKRSSTIQTTKEQILERRASVLDRLEADKVHSRSLDRDLP